MRLLFPFLFFFSPLFCFAEPKNIPELSIEDYLKIYLQSQESTQISQHQFDALEAQKNALTGWQTNLIVYPKNERTEALAKTSAFQFSTSLEQKTPLSTTFFVSFDHRNDLHNIPSQYKTNYLKVGLQQPLWKDFIGNARRAQKRSLFHQTNAAKWQHQQNTIQVCLSSISFFTSYFVEQEKNKTYKSILFTSEDVFKKTKNAFQKRMIQKSNLIAAETDSLSIKDLYLGSLNRLEKLKNKIRLDTQLYFQDLKNPVHFFEKIQPAKDLDHHLNSLALKTSLENVQNAYSQLDYAQENSKPDLQLIASAGQNIQKNELSALSTNEKIYEVGLQLQLPLWNPASHSDVSNALYQLRIAELNHQNKMKSVENDLLSQKIDFNFAQEQLKVSLKKNDLLKEQALIALRELNSGKIGFQEYILIRDRHLNEEMNALDKQKNYWDNLLKTYEASGEIPEPCNLLIKKEPT